MNDLIRRAEYLRRFDRIASSKGWQTSPARLMDGWDHTIEYFASGYDDILDEFYFDLQLRGQIEYFLTHPDLQEFDELLELRRRVEQADSRYRGITREVLPGRTEWWQTRVLRQAGAKYADDVRVSYGIDIERVDENG